MTEIRTKSRHRSNPLQRCKLKITCLCSADSALMSVYTLESYANPLFRAVGYDAILAFSFFNRRRFVNRVRSSHCNWQCTLHSLVRVRGPVCPHGTHPLRPSRSCPSRSRRFHSGTEPFGSTPWRRCEVWIHDPIRRLMGARELPGEHQLCHQDTARMLY